MASPDKATLARLRGLRRFAIAITALNVLGHTVLGFEQSDAQPVFAVLTAYCLELLLEYVDARSRRQPPAFLANGLRGFIDFLLPAHITGLAVGMLLYANDRIMPFVFASGIAICSKALFRVDTERGPRHFLNPSNFGITATLLLFPAVGIAPPYMFTEGLGPVASVVLPLLIIATGTLLNAKITRRIPLILAWLGGFVLQALLRSWAHDDFLSTVNAMSGVAFILFTFYMVTDPATTPTKKRSQVIFGLSVAMTYGALVMLHVVFGLFFSLTLVCMGRGSLLVIERLRMRAASKPLAVPVVAALSGESRELVKAGH